MKLILNMRFVTLNDYIDAERSSKFAGANIKKKQTKSVRDLALMQGFKLEPILYDVIFTWYKPNNRIDHDNITFAKKFCLDGLVSAKILKSDGSKFINNFQDIFILDRTRSYISCMIEFIEVKK